VLLFQLLPTLLKAAAEAVTLTFLDFLRFLDMANGSLRELRYQISLAQRLGYLPSQSSRMNDDSVLFETGLVLHGLIRSMRANAVREEAVSDEA
jgi:four helix bundle protein